MDIANHAVTLISIIVGIGLTEMFGNLHRLLRNRARVRWDGVAVAWAVVVLMLVINYWWAIYQGIIGLDRLGNAAQLGLILVQPILLFLLAASVLPNFDSGEEWDMRRYYEETRKAFILTFVVYQVLNYAVAIVVGTMGWNIPTALRSVILLLLVLVLVFDKRRMDWVAALTIAALLILRLTIQIV